MDNQQYPQYQKLNQQLWLRDEQHRLPFAEEGYEAVFAINGGPETVLGSLREGGRLRLELHAAMGCGPQNSIVLTDSEGNQVRLFVREKQKQAEAKAGEVLHGVAA